MIYNNLYIYKIHIYTFSYKESWKTHFMHAHFTWRVLSSIAHNSFLTVLSINCSANSCSHSHWNFITNLDPIKCCSLMCTPNKASQEAVPVTPAEHIATLHLRTRGLRSLPTDSDWTRVGIITVLQHLIAPQVVQLLFLGFVCKAASIRKWCVVFLKQWEETLFEKEWTIWVFRYLSLIYAFLSL